MKLLLAILLSCLFLVLTVLPVERNVVTPEPTPDVCSENPYYAKAIIAMPYQQAYDASAYGHAQLDALYDSLYAQGEVGPVPPACLVTARQDLTVWTTPGEGPIGVLSAGQTAAIYGRTEDSEWWYVNSGFGWGWVSREQVELQPEMQIDLIPIMG
ncbi:MAG: hypothetical protein HY866_11970 [Chloroflexi bacterium]|nr:hypothetical protein [Chloroflexota bacterium]